jgi:hypothetical protein
MAKAYTHTGSYQTIPATASPGLRFLAAFLASVDSLNPANNPLGQYLSPNAVFIINGSEPTPSSTVTGMMATRNSRLKAFRHDLKQAWDIELEDGKRMVMYESISVTIFKNDVDEKAIEIAEFSTAELEPVDGGFEGLAANVLKTFMDANPMMQRLKQIGGFV